MSQVLLTSPTVRSRYSVSDLIDRVQGDLGMRSSNLVTSADVIRWANESQDEIAQQARWFHTFTLFDTTAGTAEYDLPLYCIGVQQVRHLELILYPLRFNDLANYNPLYPSQSNGTPTHYYLQGNSALGLYPTPDTTTVTGLTVRVIYTALPPRALNTDDFYYVPPGGENAIVSYCCWKASVKDASGEGRLRMEMFERDWERRLRQLIDQVGKVSEEAGPVMGIDADAKNDGWGGTWPWWPNAVTGP